VTKLEALLRVVISRFKGVGLEILFGMNPWFWLSKWRKTEFEIILQQIIPDC